MIELLFAMMVTAPDAPVAALDSRDDSTKTYIIFDTGCKILIDKSELKDETKVVEKAWKACGSRYKY